MFEINKSYTTTSVLMESAPGKVNTWPQSCVLNCSHGQDSKMFVYRYIASLMRDVIEIITGSFRVTLTNLSYNIFNINDFFSQLKVT